MEQFSFNKKWYQSNRLRVLIITAVLLVGTDMFGIKLPESTVEMVVGLALAYITGKSIQDAVAANAEVKAKALVELSKKDPS